MRRSLLPLLLLTALRGLAQTKEEPVVHVRFRALSVDGAILGAGYLEGRNFRRLDISGDALTAEQSYTGPNPLQLVEPKGTTAAVDRQVARQAQHDLRTRLQALAAELGNLQSLAMKAKGGSEGGGGGGGGRRLASTTRPNGGGGRADEILREMEALNQRLESVEAEMNRAVVPALDPPERTGKPKATEEKPSERRVATQPLATFVFPADGRYLLLVHRTPGGTTINALDDQEGSFPFGSLQFINLTGADVDVRFGARTLALPAKGKGVLRPDAGHRTYVAGEIHTKGAEGFRLAYSLRLFQQDDVRTLYFLLPAEEGGHGVKLKGIEERRAPEPPPVAPTEKAALPAR